MGEDELSVPSHTLEALDRYFNHGFEPGSFLRAVLTNNLFEAVGRADAWNKRSLPEIVMYIYNHAPRCSWGNEEVYNSWIQKGPAFKEYEKNRVLDYLSN